MKCPYCGEEMIRGYLMSSRDITFAVDNLTKVFRIKDVYKRQVETKNIMTKSSLPVGGYSVNPYVGCTHACKYCYASFMKRFSGHKEEWGCLLYTSTYF